MNPEELAVDETRPIGNARTTTEAQILQICSAVLGSYKICGQDNFVDLGGDSISAALTLNRIHDVFQVSLPFSLLFDEKMNLAGLADAIDKIRASESARTGETT